MGAVHVITCQDGMLNVFGFISSNNLLYLRVGERERTPADFVWAKNLPIFSSQR